MNALAPLAARVAFVLLALAASSCDDAPPLAPVPDEPEASGAVVAGTVRVPDGDAVAGVAVALEPLRDGIPASVWARVRATGADLRSGGTAGEGSGVAAAPRAAVTDAHGRFAFAGVDPGAYLVRSSAQDHRAGAGLAQVLPPAEAAAETTFVDIDLVPVGKVHGTATLSGHGGSHAGTIVYVGGTSNVAVTDDAGAWLLDDVPVGTHEIRAAHVGWHDATTTAAVAAAGDSVAAGSMALLPQTNIPPTATATAAAYGSFLLPFALDGAGADLDGTIVQYAWDFEDDGVLDWSSAASPATTHVYATAGAYRAKLRVVDDEGGVAHAVVAFRIHDALHVATTGNDANDGSAAAPFLTIAHAAAESAALGGLPVRVALGTYAETLVFANGASITGGYAAGPWTRSAGSRSTVVGGAEATATALTALSVTGLRFERATPVTADAIAVRVRDCGAGVVFTDCAFVAGDAADGAPGTDGGFVSGHGGGGGGRGGSCSFPSANGAAGNGPGGGTGGPRGTGGNSGGNGGNGGPGTDGAHATAPNAGGFLWIDTWVPFVGYTGGTATPGSGGGGGGGGDFLVDCVNGGGDGGAGGPGGAGGQGGTGGQGGRASFALLSIDTAGPTAQFVNCIFLAGAAGDGGAGGKGGAGGVGGSGSPGENPPFLPSGGGGGNGGAGGWGGGGSGGPGGLSYCVYARGLAPSFTGCSFTPGAAGAGGLGGSGRFLYLTRAASGPAGTAGGVLVVP